MSILINALVENKTATPTVHLIANLIKLRNPTDCGLGDAIENNNAIIYYEAAIKIAFAMMKISMNDNYFINFDCIL